jgi:hypothetical protein
VHSAIALLVVFDLEGAIASRSSLYLINLQPLFELENESLELRGVADFIDKLISLGMPSNKGKPEALFVAGT